MNTLRRIGRACLVVVLCIVLAILAVELVVAGMQEVVAAAILVTEFAA